MESEQQSTVMFMKHCSPITKEVSYMVQECIAESSVPCLGQVIDSWTESVSQEGRQSLGSLSRKFSICSGLHHRIHSSFRTPTLTAPLPPLISQQDLSYGFNNPCWGSVRQEGNWVVIKGILGIEGVGTVVTLPLPPALCNPPTFFTLMTLSVSRWRNPPA